MVSRFVLLLGLTLLLLVTAVGADTPPAAPPTSTPPSDVPKAPSTAKAENATAEATASDAAKGSSAAASAIREGTELIDAVGQFRLTGERVAFFTADGKGRFLVLENLNLQRIVRVLGDTSVSLDWKVNGEFTEYRGSNYLFVRSAVLKVGTEVRED